MIQLHQCHKPARPESRPIQDAHWALIEQCWASIDQRPPAEDIQSSVQSFFHAFPTPQPLCDFLSDIPQMSEASLSLVSTTSGSLLGDESGDVVCDGRNEEVGSLKLQESGSISQELKISYRCSAVLPVSRSTLPLVISPLACRNQRKSGTTRGYNPT